MDRFSVRGALGVGGAGRVLLVEDRLRPGSRLALKELLDAAPDDTAALHREFARLATLRHPSLVEVYELEIDPETGRSRYTMEHIDGDDVVTTVRREGPASLVPLAAETLRALAFLHDFRLVHRDLKPGNILVRREPKAGHRVVVLDLGLAVERRTDPAAASPAMAGTLSYLAPELFAGAAPTKRADLYAFGAVVFEAVHGRAPFVLKGNDVDGFIKGVREGRRARPPLPAGYPAGLARWIDAMLAPDPADRPSSATDALARLNEACGASEPLETMADRASRLDSGAPVGRDEELAALRGAAGPSDAPRVVWLCGDAGAGKTRFLRFLAAESVGEGWRVHAPPGVLPEAPDEFVDRVRADAASAPTLVLLDEVERAENAVATFLDRIAREPRTAPVHVVAAVRAGEIANPRLRKLLGDTGVVPSLVRIDLAPLGESGLKAMIERATAGRSSAQARVKWLLEASEGNAGAAEALLVEGVWERKARVPVAEALEGSIRRRREALSLEALGWMEALAVLGDDAPEPLIGELAGLEERAPRAAEEAIAAGLARRTGTTVSPDSRRVADAMKDATPPERLRQLHAMAATHFATQDRDVFGATAWRLARLWRGAGETERAVSAALDAASAAEIAKDWAEAAERYRFALASLARRDPRRGELWMKRAEALRQATLHRDAVRAFGWAARRASTRTARLFARAMQARSFMVQGRLDEAELRASSALAAADLANDSLAASGALETLSAVALQKLDATRARKLALHGLSLVTDEHSELRAYLLYAAGNAELRLGMSSASEHFDAATRLCIDHALDYVHLMLLLARAAVYERAADLGAGNAVLAEAQRLAERHGESRWLRRIIYQSSRLALYEDRFDRAASLAQSAQELSVYAGDGPQMLTAAGIAMQALDRCGRPNEAVELARHAIGSALADRTPLWRDYLENSLVWTLAANELIDNDQIQTILDRTEAGLGAAGPIVRADVLVSRMRFKVGSGTLAELDRLSRQFEEHLSHHAAKLHRGPVAVFRLLEAVWANRLGRHERAAVAAATASEAFGEMMPSYHGWTLFAWAEAMEGLGRVDDARDARLRGRSLIDRASAQIEDADWRRDFLDQPLVRELVATVPKATEQRRIDALYDMIRALNSESDPEALFASTLEMAMRAVDAERGMILLSGPTGSDFSVRLAKNLEKETEDDAEAFSRRIVAEAEAGSPILALDAGQDERFRDFRSVNLFRIRSLMCVPLRSRGKIIGTVYLDSRRQGRLFTQDDLRFVEAFSDHAALALENVRRRAELEMENRRLRAVAGERSSYGKIVGRAPVMQKVFDLLERIATSDAPILIQGESGTGKELVARALHFNGPRKDKTFISENCAAIPESLLESELFGHVKGAFTGADKDRQGMFEQAHGGTLFLDEIGDTSPGMQARLLRVLQEGELRPVGGNHSIKVDVRLITATNKDLQSLVGSGKFREDLFYRLAVVPVQMPPLRERIGDVPFVAAHLVEQLARAKGRPSPRIDVEVFDALERYSWPGNVRQLENVLRRVLLLAGDGSVTLKVLESDGDLARMLLGKEQEAGPLLSLDKTEQEQIRRALEAAAGNRDRAARLLGISRATIYRKMREYSLR